MYMPIFLRNEYLYYLCHKDRYPALLFRKMAIRSLEGLLQIDTFASLGAPRLSDRTGVINPHSV